MYWGAMLENDSSMAIDEIHESEDDSEDAVIPGLPHWAAQQCLARVPRDLYRRLRSVSRAWKDMLRPEVIYPIRALEGISEAWLYVKLTNDDVFRALDPLLMRWHELPRIPYGDPCFDMGDKECFVAGRQLMLVGPSVQGRQIAPMIMRYSLDTNEWSVATPMNVKRYLFASATSGSAAFVAGGVRFTTTVPLNSAERFCSLTNQWEVLPDMHIARKACSGFLMDGCFYVIGGSKEDGQTITSAEYYSPKTRRWTLVEGMWSAFVRQPDRGSGAPPLVAVVRNELYSWDHFTGLLRKYKRSTNRWTIECGAPGRLPNSESHGWGIGFKAVGDELWLVGGASSAVPFIDACRPHTRSWHRVAPILNGSFVYNCAVMKA